jgi:hypothetical protein
MQTVRLLGVSLILGIAATACSSNALTGANPAPPTQTQGADRHGIGPNGLPAHISTMHGWISPDKKKKKQMLYVSDEGDGRIDIYSVPAYSLTGQITSGIAQPEGIATDKKGNLYVSNLSGGTVTVYPPGQTSPSLTLTESSGPDDVAVAKNGYVLAGDVGGGVDVYPPGQTSPTARLTNAGIEYGVDGVGVDANNNVYAAGYGNAGAAVVEFTNMSGSGTNLGLTGLVGPAGVLVDKHGNIVVSDYSNSLIDIYPSGQTSPSSTISVTNPDRSAINKKQNDIYAPQGANDTADVLSYPGGASVTSISIGNFTSGTALSPAPKP